MDGSPHRATSGSAKPADRTPPTAVFAYGSLVSTRSLAEILGREVDVSRGASLRGWRRGWSLKRDNHSSEKTFARRDDGRRPRWILSLNVEPHAPATTGPNGLLIGVSEQDLTRLDIRERRYERIDVTDQISLAQPEPAAVAEVAGFERVITYTAKPDHFAPEPPEDAVILRAYARVVEEAFATLGDAARRAYVSTTDAPPVEVVDGLLVADQIPAGSPRDW